MVIKMTRSHDDLGYTESKARGDAIQAKSKAGQSSPESKKIEEQLEEQGRIADSAHGRFYLENATSTEF
jgi:hypothetical protein